MITLVPVDRVDAVWPLVRDGLHRAMRRTDGETHGSDLYQACRRGDCFLLVVHDGEVMKGASVWKPEPWHSGMKLRCIAVAGRNMKSWKNEMHEAGRQLARDCGANGIVGEGPPAWGRAVPNARPVRILYEERLDG